MEWLRKKQQEILRRWRSNELTMSEAAAELVRLGYSSERAWDVLSRT